MDGIFPPSWESATRGTITVNGNQPRTENPAARRLLHKYFGNRSDSLPDELNRYVQHQLTKCQQETYHTPPIPFEVTSTKGKLKVGMVYSPSTRSVTLFLEESLFVQTAAVPRVPLTPREIEVLRWISVGKTDRDIAVILGISVRTVHKHVEHIFDKLGVETRTAAMSRFLESANGIA